MSQIAPVGAATPRRSTRLSQAGSVTGQSVLTAVSAGGTRQRKQGPLTKVKARKSSAYGASGRVGAAEELSVTATGFAQAFQNQRGNAVARDDEDEDDVDELGDATPGRGGQTNGHGPRFPSSSVQDLDDASSEHSEEPTPSEDWLATSVIDTSKSFGLDHEAGMLSRSTRQPSSRPSEIDQRTPRWQQNVTRQAQLKVRAENQNIEQETEKKRTPRPRPAPARPVQKTAARPALKTPEQRAQSAMKTVPPGSAHQNASTPQAVNDWLGGLENANRMNIHDWPWKTYLMRALWVLVVLVGIFLTLAFSSPQKTSDKHQRYRSHENYGVMDALGDRLFESRHALASWIKPHGGTKEQYLDWMGLQKLFNTDKDGNEMDAVQKVYAYFDLRLNDLQGTMEIFQRQLPKLVAIHKRPDGTKYITDDFWDALKSKFSSPDGAAIWEDFLKKNQQRLDGILGVPQAVTGTSSQPIAVTRDEIMKIMNDRSNPVSARIDQEILKAIQAQAPQIKSIAQAEVRQAKVDALRMQSIAESNLLVNYENNMLKTNYFSPGLGAIIDAPATSATFLDTPGFLSRFAQRLLSSPQRNPPSTALSKWEEPGECWCAAPNPTQKTQLAINVARPMYPDQITIEHVPKTMVPAKKITSAPRDVEVWVETDGALNHRYHNRKNMCKDGPPGYACLGAFKYNIHASNHVQTFDLDAEVTVPVRKTLVRVLSNWGAEYTCLYRVRLHGRDASPDFEYKVSLNDPAE